MACPCSPTSASTLRRHPALCPHHLWGRLTLMSYRLCKPGGITVACNSRWGPSPLSRQGTCRESRHRSQELRMKRLSDRRNGARRVVIQTCSYGLNGRRSWRHTHDCSYIKFYRRIALRYKIVLSLSAQMRCGRRGGSVCLGMKGEVGILWVGTQEKVIVALGVDVDKKYREKGNQKWCR